ncbi:hypothetical protein ABZ135_20110 [Streptomyces sp. NPDC006339]|uniref:hypothetical protein n=1 Tax=Streptomyces sp. NPDC006339 TaxID=3156755 RepID=UPI0033B29167
MGHSLGGAIALASGSDLIAGRVLVSPADAGSRHPRAERDDAMAPAPSRGAGRAAPAAHDGPRCGRTGRSQPVDGAGGQLLPQQPRPRACADGHPGARPARAQQRGGGVARRLPAPEPPRPCGRTAARHRAARSRRRGAPRPGGVSRVCRRSHG